MYHDVTAIVCFVVLPCAALIFWCGRLYERRQKNLIQANRKLEKINSRRLQYWGRIHNALDEYCREELQGRYPYLQVRRGTGSGFSFDKSTTKFVTIIVVDLSIKKKIESRNGDLPNEILSTSILLPQGRKEQEPLPIAVHLESRSVEPIMFADTDQQVERAIDEMKQYINRYVELQSVSL